MTTFSWVVRGMAVLPEGVREVEVAVTDGRIRAIAPVGEHRLHGERETDLATDEVLLPGLVDTHVHVNDPGRSEWEGFGTATRAAAAGGVTTILDMPLNSIPPTIDTDALALKRSVAQGAVAVDVGFWGGAVPQNLGRLRELHQEGVFGFKCFLAPSGVDEFEHLDTAGLHRALAEVAAFNGLLLVHAEDPAVLGAHAGVGGRDYAGFVASRPPQSEVDAIRCVVDGVRRTGARAHILHLSSAAALPLLRAARAEGLPITVETCPHYLVFTAETIPDGATVYKCCPPIRDSANRDALWAGLLAGDIDLVVSDHSPSTRELKLAGDGDFSLAWGGIAGLQVGLAAVWTEARRRGVGLDAVVRWMAAAPAALAGLAAKGAIRVGADADLVVLAPDEPWSVRAADLEHRNKISAYDGAPLHGVVRGAWLRGQQVHPAAADMRGQLLHGGNTEVISPRQTATMTARLIAHQYGKAETRVVRIVRDSPRHEIRDLNVSTALRGDFDAAYLDGDQSAVLPTDSQKNTAFAYAKEHGVASPEAYALTLARHFVDDIEPVRAARVDVEEYAWTRVEVDGAGHDHTWVRAGQEVRTVAVTVEGAGDDRTVAVIGGLRDLVVLKSTGSEFHGFLKDGYTTLPEADDRILATSLVAQWRYAGTDIDWDQAYRRVRSTMLATFATLHSLALQQTLWHMGRAVLEELPEVVEVRFAAPNKHHFLADLSPFGLDNPGEVFYAADRPYGLIEAVIAREGAAEAPSAWTRSVGAP